MVAVSFGIELYTLHDPSLKEKPFEAPLFITTKHVQNLIDESDARGIPVEPEMASCLTARLAGKQFTNPRELLQYVGTDCMRHCVRDDYWLSIFYKGLPKEGSIVVTDMRFPNERKLIQELGGHLIRIKRPGKGGTGHISENSLGDDLEYNTVLNNNSSIDDLQTQVRDMYASGRL